MLVSIVKGVNIQVVGSITSGGGSGQQQQRLSPNSCCVGADKACPRRRSYRRYTRRELSWFSPPSTTHAGRLTANWLM